MDIFLLENAKQQKCINVRKKFFCLEVEFCHFTLLANYVLKKTKQYKIEIAEQSRMFEYLPGQTTKVGCARVFNDEDC